MVYRPNNNTLNIDLRSEVRGYRILQTNDYLSKLALDDIRNSHYQTEHVEHGLDNTLRPRNASVPRRFNGTKQSHLGHAISNHRPIRTTGSDRYLRRNVDIGTIVVLYRIEEYV